MDFYYNEMSAACRSVMLTAKAIGVKLNKIRYDLMHKEQMNSKFIAINPQHCVPTIVDGDFKLWESRSICTYLVSQYSKDDSLYPKDVKTRATIDRFLYFDMGTMYQRFGEYVYPVLLAGAKPDPAKLEKLHEALGWLNGYLEGHNYCVGNSLTVADFVLVPTLSTILEAGIDCSKYTNIRDWVKRCKETMNGYDTENEEGAQGFGQFTKSKLST